MGKFVDLTGKTFGKLTVLNRNIEKTGKNIYYDCICECGQKRTVVGWRLTNGEIKACKTCSHRNFIDLTGQKFGRWCVVSRAEDAITVSGYHFTRWNCECECGTKREVNANSLLSIFLVSSTGI